MDAVLQTQVTFVRSNGEQHSYLFNPNNFAPARSKALKPSSRHRHTLNPAGGGNSPPSSDPNLAQVGLKWFQFRFRSVIILACATTCLMVQRPASPAGVAAQRIVPAQYGTMRPTPSAPAAAPGTRGAAPALVLHTSAPAQPSTCLCLGQGRGAALSPRPSSAGQRISPALSPAAGGASAVPSPPPPPHGAPGQDDLDISEGTFCDVRDAVGKWLEAGTRHIAWHIHTVSQAGAVVRVHRNHQARSNTSVGALYQMASVDQSSSPSC